MFIDVIALISTSLNIDFFTLRYYFTQNFTADTPSAISFMNRRLYKMFSLKHFSVTVSAWA